MAIRYYGMNKNETEVTVSQGSSTSKQVEVAVNDAVSLKKKDVFLILEDIKHRVLVDTGFNNI